MPGAMLDCVICSARKWKPLEVTQDIELREAGATRLPCENCHRETYWLYAQVDTGTVPPRKAPELRPVAAAAANPPAEAQPQPPREESIRSTQSERRVIVDRRQKPRRSQRRVALQVSVRIRVNALGSQFEEVVRATNVSRNGIYFQSAHPYSKGLPVSVVMNYSPQQTGPVSEQKGTVVRVDDPSGSAGKGIAIRLF